MKQYVRTFNNFRTSNNFARRLDDEINDYLTEHPNYFIDKVIFAGQNQDADCRVLVIFNVEEEQFRTHE